MEYHPITQQITTLLDQNGYWYETFEHEPVRTSEQAARTRPGYTLRQGAKAIIVRVKQAGVPNRFVMLVYPGDQRFNNDKAKQLLNAKDIRFGTEQEVVDLTGGVEPGGVPPFGNLFGLEVIADPTLFENQRIVFNAGDRRFSVAMLSADYKKLVNPRIESIV